MRVVCISTGNDYGVVPPIFVGNFYTVVRENTEQIEGKILRQYILEEIGPEYGYGRGNFIPVSSIDEREFVRDYNKETV